MPIAEEVEVARCRSSDCLVPIPRCRRAAGSDGRTRSVGPADGAAERDVGSRLRPSHSSSASGTATPALRSKPRRLPEPKANATAFIGALGRRLSKGPTLLREVSVDMAAHLGPSEHKASAALDNLDRHRRGPSFTCLSTPACYDPLFVVAPATLGPFYSSSTLDRVGTR